MKNIIMVYVLVHQLDYDDDGFNIIGIFSNLLTLRKYVSKRYPLHTMDSDGDYRLHTPNSNFSSYDYLDIYVHKIINDDDF
jgi:hypothetical protein